MNGTQRSAAPDGRVELVKRTSANSSQIVNSRRKAMPNVLAGIDPADIFMLVFDFDLKLDQLKQMGLNVDRGNYERAIDNMVTINNLCAAKKSFTKPTDDGVKTTRAKAPGRLTRHNSFVDLRGQRHTMRLFIEKIENELDELI